MGKNVWTDAKQKKVKAIDTFAKEYCGFLDAGKTERECRFNGCRRHFRS